MLKNDAGKKKIQPHETFDDMENGVMKIWNRCATYFNILSDINQEEAKRYVRQFSNDEIESMSKMLTVIKEVGYDKTKAMVIKGEIVIQ